MSRMEDGVRARMQIADVGADDAHEEEEATVTLTARSPSPIKPILYIAGGLLTLSAVASLFNSVGDMVRAFKGR